MEIYHKRFEVLRIYARFQPRFYIRIIILILLLIDELKFSFDVQGSLRPFLVLRCRNYVNISVLPIFYDTITRRLFEALVGCYKDIAVFLAFYSIIIIAFAVVANQVI